MFSNKNNKMSSLEKKAYQILSQEKIPFIQEKQFADGGKVKHYRFDFYLPKNRTVIEMQGIQHYQYTKVFHKTKSDFTKGQERDRRKISYCLAHDIKIYCIPFWEIDNIVTLKDLLNDRFLAKTSFHNDDVWRQQNHK